MAVRTFVFDLDGVVYRGEQPLPGAVETIEILKQLGYQVYFFTNNSTQTRTSYAAKLRRMGIPTDEHHIMTSSYATALYLLECGGQGAAAFVIGEQGLAVELAAVGIRIVGPNEPANYVVVGLDRKFNYETLRAAQKAISEGAQFIATNRDSTFPLEDGLVVPGGGAIVAAIETATQKTPVLIGKPELYALQKLLDLAHAQPQESIIVGDRLDTDVLMGKRVGALTVLVLTGVTTENDLQDLPENLRPDLIVRELPEMLERLENIFGRRPPVAV